jgi:hypothetical protein
MELLMTCYSHLSVTVSFLVFLNRKFEMHDNLHAIFREGIKYMWIIIFGISQGKAGSEVKI